MFVSLGKVEDVVDWFNERSRYPFALFFAAGDMRSGQLLEQVFEERESIDILSGLRIAVFLFARDGNSAIEYRKDHSLKILPGRVVDRITEYAAWGNEEEAFRTIHVSEIYGGNADEVKREVARHSAFATHALVDYYNLDHADLPCILIVGRGNPEPFVIKTPGVVNVEAVLSILKDVQAITLPHVYVEATQKKDACHRLHGARANLAKTERRMELAVDAWKEILVERGIPRAALDNALCTENARDFYSLTGEPILRNLPPVLSQYEDVMRLAASDSRYRQAVALVDKKRRFCDSALATYKKSAKRLQHYEDLMRDVEAGLGDLVQVRDDLDALARRYERKFAMKQGVERIAQFLRAIIGLQSRNEELVNTRSRLVELMGDPTKPDKNNHYDVALSFAGEDRAIAQRLAELIQAAGYSIFYDRFEQPDLWGKNLYDHLSIIYRDSARYCVMLLSEHYARKSWTNHERQNAQARAFSENREYILPIKIDDTEIPGILNTVGYMDSRTQTLDEIAAA